MSYLYSVRFGVPLIDTPVEVWDQISSLAEVFGPSHGCPVGTLYNRGEQDYSFSTIPTTLVIKYWFTTEDNRDNFSDSLKEFGFGVSNLRKSKEGD